MNKFIFELYYTSYCSFVPKLFKDQILTTLIKFGTERVKKSAVNATQPPPL